MLAENLKNILTDLQLTPEDFGLKIGVGKSTIYKMLRGDTKKLTNNMAQKINSFFPQYSVDYLKSFNFDTKTIKDTGKLRDSDKMIINDAFLLHTEEVEKIQAVDLFVKKKVLTAENILMKKLIAKLEAKNIDIKIILD